MDYKTNQTKQEDDYNRKSEYPGNYILNSVQNDTVKVYPWAPTIIMQKSGGAFVDKTDIIDVNSELLNITRPNSNVPTEKWLPEKKEDRKYIQLTDGLFHQKSTLLSDPPMLLREQTKNRWTDLFHDPQKTAIEPFKRNGIDTYLTLIDNYDC